MGKGGSVVPLTELQKNVLSLLSGNRSEESHLAGAAGVHMAAASPRKSAALDLFHDHEEVVASAFAMDSRLLEREGYSLTMQLSQPGFIRAVVSDQQHEQIRVDWAYDSAWRFLPPVKLEGVGFVLHPVDLAVNKVLALIGREEPRDFIDVVYLHQRVLPLGALAWAACGKDPGLNPDMLLELLSRRGRMRKEDLDRLDLVVSLDPAEQNRMYRDALQQGKEWIATRPPEEAGCLYRRSESGGFFAPRSGEPYIIHRGTQGGVLPVTPSHQSYLNDADERARLESFFDHRVQ